MIPEEKRGPAKLRAAARSSSGQEPAPEDRGSRRPGQVPHQTWGVGIRVHPRRRRNTSF
jgi:hypothetical protein